MNGFSLGLGGRVVFFVDRQLDLIQGGLQGLGVILDRFKGCAVLSDRCLGHESKSRFHGFLGDLLGLMSGSLGFLFFLGGVD